MQALLTDSLTTLALNATLVRRDLAVSSLREQVPKDVLGSLRIFPLLGDLMFYISSKELEGLKKRRNERYMYSVLKQRNLRFQNRNLHLPFVALPPLLHNRSPNLGLLRSLLLSSPRLPLSTHISKQDPNNNSKPVTTKTNPRDERLTTQRGSDCLWSHNLGHFLQGPTPSPPQNLPAC